MQINIPAPLAVLVLSKPWTVKKVIGQHYNYLVEFEFAAGTPVRVTRLPSRRRGQKDTVGVCVKKIKGSNLPAYFDVSLEDFNKIEYEDMPVAVLA